MVQGATDADDHRGGGDPRQLDDREVQRRDLHRVHVGVELCPVGAREAPDLDVLTRERLDHAHARDALLERRQRLADPVAHA